MTRMRGLLGGLGTCALFASVAMFGSYSATAAATAAAATGAPAVHVSGNSLVDAAGDPIQLLGVSRSGTEYACSQGWGFFDGPNTDASVAAMAAWHINAVRLPLNEGCWLGVKGINAQYSGVNYRKVIRAYVNLLHRHGLVVILDLGAVIPHGPTEDDVPPMADAKYAVPFWKSVATAYKDDPSILYDAYNEPNNITWNCWLHGCSSPGYRTAGMQSLVDAIRSSGSTQPILLGGLDWSNDMNGWLAHEPKDPAHALVASEHIYGGWAPCDTSCRKVVASVATHVPVVTGELGENDCKHSYVDSYMAWADTHGISYLGWAWDEGGGWTCDHGPTLITDYDGTPTGMGIGFRDHFAVLAAARG